MINVVADVFFVGEYLMNSRTVPRTPKVRKHSLGIQGLGDFRFAFSFINKRLINPPDNFNFILRPRNQDYPVGLKAFVFPHFEHGLLLAVLVNQYASQAESGSASLF